MCTRSARESAFIFRITLPRCAFTVISLPSSPPTCLFNYAKQFSGKYSHRVFKDIGHNVPQEAPQAFAQAVIDVYGY
jgi:pimeloyl-ACP methyl ester carboxylesterase